jgi:butyryl-CoA dehydrogenase
MGRAALVATEKLKSDAGDVAFLRAKIATARFYAECLLPQADAYAQAVVGGSASVLAIPAEQF